MFQLSMTFSAQRGCRCVIGVNDEGHVLVFEAHIVNNNAWWTDILGKSHPQCNLQKTQKKLS